MATPNMTPKHEKQNECQHGQMRSAEQSEKPDNGKQQGKTPGTDQQTHKHMQQGGMDFAAGHGGRPLGP